MVHYALRASPSGDTVFESALARAPKPRARAERPRRSPMKIRKRRKR